MAFSVMGYTGGLGELRRHLCLSPNFFLLPLGQGTVFMSACQQYLWTPTLSLLGHPKVPHSLTAPTHGQQSLSTRGEALEIKHVPAWSSGMWV